MTGATAGIGLEFARRLAERGHDLVLVARDTDRMTSVAADLSARFGCEVESLRADLTDRDDMHRVAARLADPDRPVDVLVNNAGFGLNHFVVGGEIDDELRQLDILCTAVLVLSHAAAGAMKARRRGAIITIASVSAFTSLASYSAAKAWALVFSEVLAGELRGTGVTVTAVCPGFTRSEFHQRAGMDMSRLPGFMWLTAGHVADAGLAAARRGQLVVIPGAQYRVLSALLQIAPRGLRWWVFWGRPGARREGARR